MRHALWLLVETCDALQQETHSCYSGRGDVLVAKGAISSVVAGTAVAFIFHVGNSWSCPQGWIKASLWHCFCVCFYMFAESGVLIVATVMCLRRTCLGWYLAGLFEVSP